MVAKRDRATLRPNYSLRSEADLLPEKVPPIRLRYGQAIWLLTELGLRGPVSKNTFHEYIKALRKLGIPFGHKKFQTKHRRRLAVYSYCQLTELAVTLSLRVYHVVPDAVLRAIILHRTRLHRLYRRAYQQRHSGLGRPVVIESKGHKAVALRGLFLDLNIKFSGGHLVRFGPPKLLPPIEALGRFSESVVCARPLAPINLSLLSEQVIALALRAPDIRSGPHRGPARVSSARHRYQDFGEHKDKTRLILSGLDVNGS